MSNRIEHRVIDGIEYKHCSKCGAWRPLIQFARNKCTWDKLYTSCKPCNHAYNTSRKEYMKIYNKQYRLENREQIYQYNKAYKEKHCKHIVQTAQIWRKENLEHRLNYNKSRSGTLQVKAGRAVKFAILRGDLVRPCRCELCGKQSEKIEAHHWAYGETYWLDVVWVCKLCHAKLHRKYAHEEEMDNER